MLDATEMDKSYGPVPERLNSQGYSYKDTFNDPEDPPVTTSRNEHEAIASVSNETKEFDHESVQSVTIHTEENEVSKEDGETESTYESSWENDDEKKSEGMSYGDMAMYMAIAIIIIGTLFLIILGCKKSPVNKDVDPNSESKKNELAVKITKNQNNPVKNSTPEKSTIIEKQKEEKKFRNSIKDETVDKLIALKSDDKFIKKSSETFNLTFAKITSIIEEVEKQVKKNNTEIEKQKEEKKFRNSIKDETVDKLIALKSDDTFIKKSSQKFNLDVAKIKSIIEEVEKTHDEGNNLKHNDALEAENKQKDQEIVKLRDHIKSMTADKRIALKSDKDTIQNFSKSLGLSRLSPEKIKVIIDEEVKETHGERNDNDTLEAENVTKEEELKLRNEIKSMTADKRISLKSDKDTIQNFFKSLGLSRLSPEKIKVIIDEEVKNEKKEKAKKHWEDHSKIYLAFFLIFSLFTFSMGAAEVLHYVIYLANHQITAQHTGGQTHKPPTILVKEIFVICIHGGCFVITIIAFVFYCKYVELPGCTQWAYAISLALLSICIYVVRGIYVAKTHWTLTNNSYYGAAELCLIIFYCLFLLTGIILFAANPNYCQKCCCQK